jgi:hypothetical protein
MTERPEPLRRALARYDITRAMTPGQLVLAAVAIWLLLRFIRSLRT